MVLKLFRVKFNKLDKMLKINKYNKLKKLSVKQSLVMMNWELKMQ